MPGKFILSVGKYGVLFLLAISMVACGEKDKTRLLLDIQVKGSNIIDKSEYNTRLNALERSKTGVLNLHAVLSELFYIDKTRDSIIAINKLDHETMNVYAATIIFDNVPDDGSVSGYRYDVQFQRKRGGVIEIAEVKYSWLCWEGRGHHYFSNKLYS